MKNLVFMMKSYKLAMDRNRTILNFNENKIFKKDVVLTQSQPTKIFLKKTNQFQG